MPSKAELLLFLLLFCILYPELADAGYLWGLGYNPIIQMSRGPGQGGGNYGFGMPYSPYAYSYGSPYQGGGANGAGGFYGGAFGPNFNDFTLKNSAFGLGFGYPYYG